MKENKYEREVIGYYVLNKTGEIKELYSDQYIVNKREREQFRAEFKIKNSPKGKFLSDEKIKEITSQDPEKVSTYPFEGNYFKASKKELKKLLPELDIHEKAMLISILPNIGYDGCIYIGHNKNINAKDLAKLSGMSERCAKETIKKLHSKRIIASVSEGRKRKYYMNPFICGIGKDYPVKLRELFGDYSIRSLKGETINKFYEKGGKSNNSDG